MMWMMLYWAGPWMYAMAAYWIASAVAVLWALIDLSHARKDAGYKLIWAAITVVLGLIGVLLYYAAEKVPGKEARTVKRHKN